MIALLEDNELVDSLILKHNSPLPTFKTSDINFIAGSKIPKEMTEIPIPQGYGGSGPFHQKAQPRDAPVDWNLAHPSVMARPLSTAAHRAQTGADISGMGFMPRGGAWHHSLRDQSQSTENGGGPMSSGRHDDYMIPALGGARVGSQEGYLHVPLPANLKLQAALRDHSSPAQRTAMTQHSVSTLHAPENYVPRNDEEKEIFTSGIMMPFADDGPGPQQPQAAQGYAPMSQGNRGMQQPAPQHQHPNAGRPRQPEIQMSRNDAYKASAKTALDPKKDFRPNPSLFAKPTKTPTKY